MRGYYAEKLAAERLRACYDLAPPRVRAYLDGEIEHVLGRIGPDMLVLELGCGYGRVLKGLAASGARLVGIDNAVSSLRLAISYLQGLRRVGVAAMDAVRTGFGPGTFDVVLCVQNGISAFGADRRTLVAEAVRVTRGGGRVLFSSYSEGFWKERLAWFRIQAEHGLIGEIDEDATGSGVIVCRDGFRATTVAPGEFRELAAGLGLTAGIEDVGGASLFCEIPVT